MGLNLDTCDICERPSFMRCVCVLVCGNCISILCVLMRDCPPCPTSPPLDQAVFAEMRQANLITSKEWRGLHDPRHVVTVQSGKSPEVLTKTADVLQRHGFEKESKLLAGRQTQSVIHIPVVCCTVEPSCKGHLIIHHCAFHTHTMLGHRVYQSHTAFSLGHLMHISVW